MGEQEIEHFLLLKRIFLWLSILLLSFLVFLFQRFTFYKLKFANRILALLVGSLQLVLLFSPILPTVLITIFLVISLIVQDPICLLCWMIAENVFRVIINFGKVIPGGDVLESINGMKA